MASNLQQFGLHSLTVLVRRHRAVVAEKPYFVIRTPFDLFSENTVVRHEQQRRQLLYDRAEQEGVQTLPLHPHFFTISL